MERNLCSADLEKFVLDPGYPKILALCDACIDEIEGAKSKERERSLSQLKSGTVYYKYDNDETEVIVQLTDDAFKKLVKKNHNTILSENRRVTIELFESIVDWVDFSANPPIVTFVQSELALERRSTSGNPGIFTTPSKNISTVSETDHGTTDTDMGIPSPSKLLYTSSINTAHMRTPHAQTQHSNNENIFPGTSPGLVFINQVFKYILTSAIPGKPNDDDSVEEHQIVDYVQLQAWHSSNTSTLSITDLGFILPNPAANTARSKVFKKHLPWTSDHNYGVSLGQNTIEMGYLILALSLHFPDDILPSTTQKSQNTSESIPSKSHQIPVDLKTVIPKMMKPENELILQHFTTSFLVQLLSSHPDFKAYIPGPEANFSDLFMNSGTLSPDEQKTTNLLKIGSHRSSLMRQDNSISVHGRKLVNIEQKVDYCSLSLSQLFQELINLFNQCRIVLFNDLSALKALEKTFKGIEDISNYGILWDSFQIVIFEIKIFNLNNYYNGWNCRCDTVNQIPIDTFRRIQIIPVSEDSMYPSFQEFLLSPGFQKNVALRKIISDANPMYNPPIIPMSAFTLKKADRLELEIPLSARDISLNYTNFYYFETTKTQKKIMFSIIISAAANIAESTTTGSTDPQNDGINASISELTNTILSTPVSAEDTNADLFQILLTPLLRKEREDKQNPNYFTCSLTCNNTNVRLFIKKVNKGTRNRLYPFIITDGKKQSTILQEIFDGISCQDLPAKPLCALYISLQPDSLASPQWYEFSHYVSPLSYDLGGRDTTFKLSWVNYQKITNSGESWDSHWKLVNMLLHQVNQLHNKGIFHNDINHFNVIIRSLNKGIDQFPDTMKIFCDDDVCYQIVLVDFDYISKKPPLNPSTIEVPIIIPPYKGRFSLLKEDGNPNFPSVSNDYYGILRSILCFQQKKCIFADQNTSSEEFAKVEFAAVKKGLASWVSNGGQQMPEHLKKIFTDLFGWTKFGGKIIKTKT